MITFLNKFTTEEDFSTKKESLDEQEHYVSYIEDDDNINIKKMPSTVIVKSYDSFLSDLPQLRVLKAYTDESKTNTREIQLKKGINYFNNDEFKYGIKTGKLTKVIDNYYVLEDEGIDLGFCILESVNLKNYDTSNYTDMSHMFVGSYLTSLDLSNFGTSKVTDMSYMFVGLFFLTSLDLSSFDTSQVSDMCGMFSGCSCLTRVDLSSFDTSKVTDISIMFYDDYSLKNSTDIIGLNLLNTSNVENMNTIFASCSGLTSLDLSNFNTSNVTNMEEMFSGCIGLTSIDVSKFDTSKVTSMQSMFKGCSSLTHIKCKQAFKDWCITNQDTIELPTAMRNGGSGQWEIID